MNGDAVEGQEQSKVVVMEEGKEEAEGGRMWGRRRKAITFHFTGSHF